jgi:hypothetical protein
MLLHHASRTAAALHRQEPTAATAARSRVPCTSLQPLPSLHPCMLLLKSAKSRFYFRLARYISARFFCSLENQGFISELQNNAIYFPMYHVSWY